MPTKPKKTNTEASPSDELPVPEGTEESPAQDTDVEMVEMEFLGQTFHFPKDRDEWPTTAIVAISELRIATATREVLGPVQWQTLNRLMPRYKDFQTTFIPAFAKAQEQCTGG